MLLVVMAATALVCAAGCSSDPAAGSPSGEDDAGAVDAPADGHPQDVAQEALSDAPDGDGADVVAPHPCSTADEIPPSGMVSGTINPVVAEAHHYRFEATKHELVRLATATAGGIIDGQVSIDPAVTLLSEDGSEVLASWDDNWFGHPGEVSLVTRLPADATYCVRIEHASSWAGIPYFYAHQMSYTLSLTRMNEEPGTYDADTEPNDDVSTAQWVDSGQGYAIIGDLDGPDDVDVYRISSPSRTPYIVEIPPSGPGGPGVNGDGSTLALGDIEVTDESGAILARSVAADGARFAMVDVPEGQDLILTVRRKAGTSVGDNDFYTLGPRAFFMENTLEAEAAAGENDERASAEQPVTYFQGPLYVVELTGRLNEAQGAIDVDYWSIPTEGHELLEVFCRSNRLGSGVLQPRFAIVDDDGNVLREGTESPEEAVIWANHQSATESGLTLPDGERVYLRVTGAGQAPDVASRLYFCRLYKWGG